MDSYKIRVVDGQLDELIDELPAISLDGPKGVGKTETASRRASKIFSFDHPVVVESFQTLANPLDEPSSGTILIDEWQRFPHSWDLVRRAVDSGAPVGRFLLTGSATPHGVSIHSGAGRIVSVRMRPLSLAEREIAQPVVSLKNLLDREMSGTKSWVSANKPGSTVGSTLVDLADYVREITASGFPGIRDKSERGRQTQLAGYVERIVDHEFAELGVRVRRKETLRAWMRAYAAASASTASYSTMLEAATPGQDDKPAKTTTMVYRDVLDQLWLLDPVSAWLPFGREFTRLGSASKHFLADPALACQLLDLTERDLLYGLDGADRKPLGAQEGTLLGRLFESLIAQSLHVYAQACDGRLRHFRTRNGDREIDFIVEKGPRSIVAIEVKLARGVSDADVKHLLWLKSQLGDDLRAMMVVTAGQNAYVRKDGVIVVPAALLGP